MSGIDLGAPLVSLGIGRLAFDALWFDHEGDGDQDVYVVNDLGGVWGGNTLWRNDDGELVDGTNESGTGLRLDGMGADSADIDGDGRMDLKMRGPRRRAAARAARAQLRRGVGRLGPGAPRRWGLHGVVIVAEDLDNDGDRDLLIAHGDKWGPTVHGGVSQ